MKDNNSKISVDRSNITDNDSGNIYSKNDKLEDMIIARVKGVELFEMWK